MLKMKYSELTAFPFQMVMQKLNAAPTDGRTAYVIRRMAAAIKEIREKISAEYKKELMEVFAKRDAEGKIEGGEDGWEVPEEKREEFKKVQEAFTERVAEIDRPKFTTHDIRDIKLTADELGALEPILDMSGFDAPTATPGVPAGGQLTGGKKLRQA